jgi:DNA (cytosine-5)-methyltransferase 1
VTPSKGDLVALDLFAGTGWGVACQWLGIAEHGVEVMPEAVAVRALNGMSTVYNDVWRGLLGRERTPAYNLLIASPPCQTFSMAGGGAGRKALDEVLAAIDAGLYLEPARLVEFGETHDPKTALVLAPLAQVARDLPPYVVLEQVPPVLPVWQRYAEVMREWGYSVWVGILSAEQYGVPQTRKRAILIARADGVEAVPPTPTHSAYYPRDPQRLDEGVAPWVSMAEALGWGMTARPAVTAGNAVGRAEGVGGSGAKRTIEREKAADRWLVGFPRKVDENDRRAADGDGEYRARDLRPSDVPAQHVTEKVRSWSRLPIGDPGAPEPTHLEGHQYPDNKSPNKPNERQRRAVDAPAMTMTAGARSAQWVHERPATAVIGNDSRVWAPGHKVNADDIARLGDAEARERYGDRAGKTAERITVAEAAALQSYPPGFRWDASMPDAKGNLKPITATNTYLQIGNAVPPVLAAAILETLKG